MCVCVLGGLRGTFLQHKPFFSVGGIAGAAVGGTVFILIIIIIVAVVCRRRRRRKLYQVLSILQKKEKYSTLLISICKK